MKKLFIAFSLIFIIFTGYAQLPSLDTTYRAKGLWATGILLPPTDTANHKQGVAIKQGVFYYGNGNRWQSPSSGNVPTFFTENDGRRTATGRTSFSTLGYTFDSLKSFTIRDTGISNTGKLFGNTFKLNNGLSYSNYDSISNVFASVNPISGVRFGYNNITGSVNNRLEINNSGTDVYGKLKIVDGTEGIGKALVSDANGVGTWTTIASGGGIVNTIGVTTANGVSATSSGGADPRLTVSLGTITPTSITATSTITGSNLSGTNTGDNAPNSLYSGLTNNWTVSGNDIYNNNIGNVGIGTNNPISKLSIVSTGGLNSGIKLQATSATQYVTIDFSDQLGNTTGQFLNTNNGFNNAAFKPNGTYLTNYRDELGLISSAGFKINTGGINDENERLRITSNGNVGIGTTAPTSKLQVDGGITPKLYTVATLPTGQPIGTLATVSDATAPTYLGTLIGGGSIVTPAFYNGTTWVSH